LRGAGSAGTPIETWVFAQDRDAGFHDFAEPTHDVLAFYSERIGPFSYEKLANVQSAASGGGMEAASAIMYGANSVSGTRAVRWRNVVIHEIAHQWWGHEVGWQTYRDQWLSEGGAEFTAAVVLQFTETLRSYDRFWEERREHILTRRGSVPTDQAGAISQGYRLASRTAPFAAQTIMYEKGAYVIHMLRMMMRDPTKPNPDAAFIAMVKDFLETYAGKNPSTSDFQSVVERHMIPAMDAGGNHRMDYFFSQWVDGIEIPKLRSDLQASDAGGGKYRISGTVVQEYVSAGFRTVVPIYLDMGGDNIARLGQVHLSGQTPAKVDVTLPLPSAPRKIVINALHDVLVRD